MTNTLPPLHMYAGSATHFRDPFASKDFYNHRSRASWNSYPSELDLNRALTPPPEMSNATYTSKPVYYQQEHGHHYGDHMPAQQAYRAPVAPYLPQETSNTTYGRYDRTTRPSSRAVSPVLHPRQAAVSDYMHQQQQRCGSQADAIAPVFQIPKTVNDSGGSLSELAAQVSMM